jgi:hypothetical protein
MKTFEEIYQLRETNSEYIEDMFYELAIDFLEEKYEEYNDVITVKQVISAVESALQHFETVYGEE